MPGLDFREVQDIVDDTEEMLPRGLDRRRPLALAQLQLAAQQQLVHAEHAVERRADLMTHGREKLALGAARPPPRLPWQPQTPGAPSRILGQQQVRGAHSDLLLEMPVLGGEGGIALLDGFEHPVEASGKAVEFINVAGARPGAEISVPRDAIHYLIKSGEWLKDRAVEAANEQ